MSFDPRTEFKRRALEDTGFMARRVLGFNYDEAEDPRPGMPPRKINVGTGGIRADGPYKEISDFLDGRTSTSRYKHLEAPRGTYKSTFLQAFCARHLAANPNIRILYGMKTKAKAREKAQGLRSHFENRNSLFYKTFGNLRGDVWAQNEFNVAGRTIGGMQEFSFQTFGRDNLPTGGHYEIIILDDLVDKDNITAEGIARTLEVFNIIEPLLVHGGMLIVCGTRYCDGDLYGTLIEEMSGVFDTLIFDAGVDIVEKDDGRVVLEPTPDFPIFPALDIGLLREKFQAMGGSIPDFCAQYLNQIRGGATQAFKRSSFRFRGADADLLDSLTCYMLTDTAVTEKEEACHSVIALVGLDAQDDAYLLDLQVGHWQPVTFVEKFCSMLTRWSSQVYLHAQTLENIALNEVFKALLDLKCKELGLRMNLIGLPRSSNADAKRRRISRLQPRLAGGHFFVCNTVPKLFLDLAQNKLLFDPEGKETESGGWEPAGELVDQFVRWPRFPRNDIADALADIDAVEKDGRRICMFLPGRVRSRRRTRGSRVGEVLRRGSRSLTATPRRVDTSGGSYVERIHERITRRR